MDSLISDKPECLLIIISQIISLSLTPMRNQFSYSFLITKLKTQLVIFLSQMDSAIDSLTVLKTLSRVDMLLILKPVNQWKELSLLIDTISTMELKVMSKMKDI